MITIQGSVSKSWLHKKIGVKFDEEYFKNPDVRYERDAKCHQYVAEVFPSYAIYHMESNLVQATYQNQNQVLVGGLQPNLILAVCLGSNFVYYDDKDPDVTIIPLSGLEDVNELPSPKELCEHPLIQRIIEQVYAVCNRWGAVRQPIPAFFWDTSGRATIHGPLTTAQKLMGENIFMVLVEKPEFAIKFFNWIIDVYVALCEEMSKVGNIPVTSFHVGECSACMVSDDMYQKHLVPTVSRIGRRYGRVRMHSCGQSDHLLKAFAGIEGLASVDTGSNTSVAAIRQVYGAKFPISIAPPPAELLSRGTPVDIITWLDNIIEANKGGPLGIVYHLEHNYPEENCLLLHNHLVELGEIQPVRQSKN